MACFGYNIMSSYTYATFVWHAMQLPSGVCKCMLRGRMAASIAAKQLVPRSRSDKKIGILHIR